VAAQNGVTLEIDVPGEGAWVTGDRDQLAQVFTNLIDNAMKYGGEGATVRVRAAAPSKANPGRHGVTVEDTGPGIPREHIHRQALASGEADINNHFVGALITRMEAGDPIVILAGLHIGCFELFGTDSVRTIRDLKGKTVSVLELGSVEYVYLASMMAYVGLDPGKDIHWVTHPPAVSMRLLAEGKVDAFLGFPPSPQELRAKQIGHVVVNSTVDPPWSQYFCCMLAGNREFVRKHPIATKRALRAILKANTICSLEPERTARFLVDEGFTSSYDYALQNMKDIPYSQWREYSAEDTLRFYALRLREAGLIKSSPKKIIAQGTDWRFLNELKQELKG
jgi:NitT/TauT family transport system substrate-binding protein